MEEKSYARIKREFLKILNEFKKNLRSKDRSKGDMHTGFTILSQLMEKFVNLQDTYMDKKIAKISKENKKEGKDLKSLAKADKKRDKVCDYGEKMMKAKKKKK
jgi:hypothetical protein